MKDSVMNWRLIGAEAIIIGLCLDKLGIIPVSQAPWFWWSMIAMAGYIIAVSLLDLAFGERQ